MGSVIKNLTTKSSTRQGGFIGEFYRTFKELTSILLKHFQKNVKGGNASKFIL